MEIEISEDEINCMEIAAEVMENEGGDATKIRNLITRIREKMSDGLG